MANNVSVHPSSFAASPRSSRQQGLAGLRHAVLCLQAILQEKLRRPLHRHANPGILLVLIPATATATSHRVLRVLARPFTCHRQGKKGQGGLQAADEQGRGVGQAVAHASLPAIGSAATGLSLQLSVCAFHPLARLFAGVAAEHVYSTSGVERPACMLQ